MASSSGWFPEDESTLFQSSSSSSTSLEDEELFSIRMRRETQNMLNCIPIIHQAYTDQSSRRQYINRDREKSHQQLWDDDFSDNCTYPPDFFRRRFRMRRELFLRISNDLENHNSYFIRKRDAIGRLGLSSIQKITAALRILAYGFSADHCDEYFKIGETTASTTLKIFCSSIIELYEEQYMRSPNEYDIARLLQEGESRGFPGMLGSLDCMHWEWKNCPTAWHGTHRGRHHKPTLILEAVASQDLDLAFIFWHGRW
ncbi:PREDICTED: uncharacterized protein LOC105961511 [Erythranthe guttata]|uniref:uncharacterized protein LOC105961511 n=1 Tax=Erythranthe guttata TaxID=4155 RepID=UPI00064D7E5E|nr:PREDICTED: uncharacterized protein LOC105961511 [Erythranthe guttata]|eukprot:XP_012841194.1 PREDICTED: uncharacterized protein LOC105961511 [Erythranthe guttata]